MEKSRNDLNIAVPKFCLVVEEYRRVPDGRVRTSQEFLGHFFPHDDKGSKDELFRHMPKEVRGPILSAWGIRGLKAALRDDDDKVQSVVFDALIAGDIDHTAFEDGLGPDTLVKWVPLPSWWSFWRGGKLAKKSLGKALETAYELGLFDARWFFDTVEARGGKLRGTDVIAEGLTKADLSDWIKKIHTAGDGSPRGLLHALGWEKIVSQTSNDILVAVLDAMAIKNNLVEGKLDEHGFPTTMPGASGIALGPASAAIGTIPAPGAVPPPPSISRPSAPPPMSAPPSAVSEAGDAPELSVGEVMVDLGDEDDNMDPTDSTSLMSERPRPVT